METETKPDIDFVPVEMEPMHKERWRSDSIRLVYAVIPPHMKCLWHQHTKYSVYVVVAPLDVTEHSYGDAPHSLVQDKGSVFCRDHTEDKLLHVASTRELPSMIVIVEMLKDAREYLPHDQIVIHVSKGVELLNDEPRCRVYRLTLQDDPTEDQGTMELSLDLPTEAVLVALDDCDVDIKSSSDSRFEAGRTLSLKVANDVRLPLAKFSIKLVSSTVKKTQFILTEIY
ncbi:hypothetical protein PC116_g19296 [Phytophthora cactorum]|uniref:Uncharacterized protein n=2 Tax=Phytophthora cactorum TaxID=29920 RepID=A0A8T0YYY4_9STRA|nr:hypothetical protein PC112_g14618 [Phytophthora cactorum]KAG2821246.1 hypothetical protein PC111_g11110 [Phytophthora cactorum]KAG2854867.1 hypothetical protein PC113_g12937 [Phytophthora cactorum]KAG2924435.1 hypothetical protein PC117_g15409 [Phytophthora cactorum]KAG2973267.1 hypothetical protein PC118_g15231 [Phytophthora cactorum]